MSDLVDLRRDFERRAQERIHAAIDEIFDISLNEDDLVKKHRLDTLAARLEDAAALLEQAMKVSENGPIRNPD